MRAVLGFALVLCACEGLALDYDPQALAQRDASAALPAAVDAGAQAEDAGAPAALDAGPVGDAGAWLADAGRGDAGPGDGGAEPLPPAPDGTCQITEECEAGLYCLPIDRAGGPRECRAQRLTLGAECEISSDCETGLLCVQTDLNVRPDDGPIWVNVCRVPE